MSFNRYQEERLYGQEQYGREGFEGERLYAPPPESAYERREGRFYEDSPGAPRYNNGNFQRNERLGELGAVAAGAFAIYEAEKAKSDPLHAAKHKHEEEAAALGALGSGGYAYYEDREKNKFDDGRRW